MGFETLHPINCQPEGLHPIIYGVSAGHIFGDKNRGRALRARIQKVGPLCVDCSQVPTVFVFTFVFGGIKECSLKSAHQCQTTSPETLRILVPLSDYLES